MIVTSIVSCDPEMPVVRITATPVSSLMHVHSVFCVSLFIQVARILYFVNSNSIRLLCNLNFSLPCFGFCHAYQKRTKLLADNVLGGSSLSYIIVSENSIHVVLFKYDYI